jgi:L-alanine-DL-glutamate epimerase-like enolase superfamily enzyme
MKVDLRVVRAEIARASNRERSWHERQSVHVRLEHDGFVGWGEAAPLPGVSPDTFADALQALRSFEWPREPVIGALAIASPSARFAAESALHSLAAASRGVPMWSLFAERASSLPIAVALFDDDLSPARGAAAIKIKIGRSDDHARLERVRAEFPHVELRLDANRAPIDLHSLSRFDPAFVEEPAGVLAIDRAPCALAVDESLTPEVLDHLRAAVRVVVIKPSLHGLLRSLTMGAHAQSTGREVVISHLLEGPIARAACAHLALAIGGRAPGLGEHPALAPLGSDFCAPYIERLVIHPPDRPGL